MPMFMRAVSKRRLPAFVALAVAAAVAALPGAASADEAHVYGEMVDYPLVFPVEPDAGQDVWYWDTFYDARPTGQHHAQDLMTDKMVPVMAASSGYVGYVNWGGGPERCCSLTIDHDDGWESWYIHLNNDTPGTDDGLSLIHI